MTQFRPSTTSKPRGDDPRFESLALASPLGIYQADAEGRCIYANPRMCDIFGVEDQGPLLGDAWFGFVHEADRGDVRTFLERARSQAGRAGPVRVRVSRPDGEIRWVESLVVALHDAGGHDGWVGTVDDITSEVTTRDTTARLSEILEATPDFVAISRPDGRLTYMNRAARRAYGLAPEDDLADVGAFDIYTSWARQKLVEEVVPILEQSDRWSGEMAFQGAHGVIHVHQSIVAHRDAGGDTAYYSSISRDLTERKRFERQLSRHAEHDALTSLPNRPTLMARLEETLRRNTQLGRGTALLTIDVDRFKVVNDSLGRDAGDQVLRALAHRIQGALRPADMVARLAGDEFVVLCGNVPDDGAATAQRIEEAVKAPFVLRADEVSLSVSIGVADTSSLPAAAEPAEAGEMLLRNADTALGEAKRRGRARHQVFDTTLRTRMSERLELEVALRNAIDRGELTLHYQPMASLRHGRVVGVEALVRWQHPTRGLLMPEDFIPLAEEVGLIVPLGDWVIATACRQVAEWRDQLGAVAPRLWVNISAQQLNHDGLVPSLTSALDAVGVKGNQFGIEITESSLMDDSDATATVLREIRDLGVSVAVDDFGTGYSSLTYLKRFPIGTLKVDRTFVDGLGREPEDTAIVTAQVSMARALGLGVVAEGVETTTQLDHLRELGCDEVQGFLVAAPCPADTVVGLLDLRLET